MILSTKVLSHDRCVYFYSHPIKEIDVYPLKNEVGGIHHSGVSLYLGNDADFYTHEVVLHIGQQPAPNTDIFLGADISVPQGTLVLADALSSVPSGNPIFESDIAYELDWEGMTRIEFEPLNDFIHTRLYSDGPSRINVYVNEAAVPQSEPWGWGFEVSWPKEGC